MLDRRAFLVGMAVGATEPAMTREIEFGGVEAGSK